MLVMVPVTKHKQSIATLMIFLILLLVVGCSPSTSSSGEIENGSSRSEVIDTMGQPTSIQDFVLPDQPFFGPQESLANLLPPGAVVEEWVYELDGEIMFIWFASEANDPREDWLVIATGIYPEGAVF